MLGQCRRILLTMISRGILNPVQGWNSAGWRPDPTGVIYSPWCQHMAAAWAGHALTHVCPGELNPGDISACREVTGAEIPLPRVRHALGQGRPFGGREEIYGER